MKKIFFYFLIFLYFSNLNAEENLKFYINKAIENNLQLNAERKNLESANKIKIFQEVNFYQVLLFLEIKLVQLQLIRTNQSGKV